MNFLLRLFSHVESPADRSRLDFLARPVYCATSFALVPWIEKSHDRLSSSMGNFTSQRRSNWKASLSEAIESYRIAAASPSVTLSRVLRDTVQRPSKSKFRNNVSLGFTAEIRDGPVLAISILGSSQTEE